MALAKCGKCGNELAPQAAACVPCGTPVSKPGLSKVKVALLVFGTLSLFCFGLCARGAVSFMGGSNQPTVSSSFTAAQSSRRVEIGTLLSEYRDNEVRADSRFKGPWIQTSGYVDDVKRDFFNSIYVTLGTGQPYETPQVQCFFDDARPRRRRPSPRARVSPSLAAWRG